MSASTTGSWWQYARWTINISRNCRITAPSVSEKAAMVTFLKAIWNPVTQTGIRSWMDQIFKGEAVASATDDYKCNLDNEPSHVIVKLVEDVGHNMRHIPITDAEKTLVDTLIASTGNRRLGTGPYFGNVGGQQ